jgi:pimeloyl-ACP methyl ester carboxylesterase
MRQGAAGALDASIAACATKLCIAWARTASIASPTPSGAIRAPRAWWSAPTASRATPATSTSSRGGDSDVLPRDVAREMLGRGPKAQLVEFRGVGHAPALMDEEQIAAIERFLAA